VFAVVARISLASEFGFSLKQTSMLQVTKKIFAFFPAPRKLVLRHLEKPLHSPA